MTCGGWTDARASRSGLVLSPSGGINTYTPSQAGDQANLCDVARSVACCKPRPVGEPQASMMLPAGLGALAMLSALRTS